MSTSHLPTMIYIFAGLVIFNLALRFVTSWISAESLSLLDARQSIKVGSEDNEIRLVTKRELLENLNRDSEIW